MHRKPNVIPLNTAATDKPDYLTAKEAAEILRVSPGTLEVWRRTGAQDLRFYRRGRSIFYDRKVLYDFMSGLMVEGNTN